MLCLCWLAGAKREVTTIYEIVQDAEGAAYAVPDYQFTCEWAACCISLAAMTCSTGCTPRHLLHLYVVCL